MRFFKIVLSILVLSSFAAFGQTEKGNFLIGASTGINYSAIKTTGNNVTTETRQIIIAPEGGYFIIDNLAIGLNTTFSSSKTDNNTKTNSFVALPFAKYYFLKGNIRVFGQVGYGFGRIKSDVVTTTPFGTPVLGNVTSDLNSFLISAGGAFFINKFLSIELFLNYTKQNADSTNSFNTGVFEQSQSGLTSSVGFFIFL